MHEQTFKIKTATDAIFEEYRSKVSNLSYNSKAHAINTFDLFQYRVISLLEKTLNEIGNIECSSKHERAFLDETFKSYMVKVLSASMIGLI